MKKIFIVVLSMICIICAGCAQIKFDLTITSEGTVIRRWQFLGTAPFSQQIENIKIKNEKLFPDLKIKTIVEGDMHGYEFLVEHPDIESFAKSTSDIYGAYKGKNKGISQHKSWFFDEYEFDFWAENTANIPVGTTVNEALFSQVVYDNIIRLPYSVESTNAEEVSDDGKVLKWNLAPLLIYGGEKYMNARFKLWHKDKIALTAAIELLFLAGTIFFFVKARAEDIEMINKDLRFKRNVFASLFIALLLVSIYMIFTPIVFTEADIISLTLNP